MVRSLDEFPFHVDDDIEWDETRFVLVPPEHLAKNTAAPIPVDCLADAPRGGESKANPTRVTFENECGEIPGVDLPPSLIHAPED
jgi:hypothetical protein